MTFRKHLDHFMTAGIDFLFRKKSRGLVVFRVGVALLIALIAGLTLSVTIPVGASSFTVGWGNSGIDPLVTAALIIGAVAVIGFGLYLVWLEHKAERKRRVFVIELRGLRDWNGAPLVEQVPASVDGTREEILLDVRQRVADGVIVDPAAALKRIVRLRDDLSLREDGRDRADFSHVVGGLAPVPLTFLTGVIVDDEAPIVFMDWDRHAKKWHSLDEADDSNRFVTSGINELSSEVGEVALAVSASYQVDLANAQKLLPALPLVHMKLDGASTTSHLSAVKQIALGKQFLDVCLQLHARGATRIHLFLAAPSSLTLRLGTLYDKRNLPPVCVYQYEQGKEQPFAWSIDMPVAGLAEPRLLQL